MSAPQTEVPVHKVAKTLFHVDVNTKASQRNAMHARCTVPDTIRMLLGQLQAIHDVAANQGSEVYKLCTDGDVFHATSPQTAQRCLIEANLTAFELFVLEEIHGCKDLVLGLDGTSTYFGREFNEFHISGKTETELIGLLDCVGKTALDMLNQFILVWAKVNDVEARFSLPRTPLYAITSLTADTTTAMSGEFGGFQKPCLSRRVWGHGGKMGA